MSKKLIINTNNRKIKSLCKKVYEFMFKKFDEFSKKMVIIDFISPAEIKKLKKQIWNINVYTDTITLIFEDSIQIYLSKEIIKKNSLINNNAFESELILVLIHSLLHSLNKNEDEVIKIQDVFFEEFHKENKEFYNKK
ncbi:MAG: rRNA maturation RNAse YbeY [bacterium]